MVVARGPPKIEYFWGKRRAVSETCAKTKACALTKFKPKIKYAEVAKWQTRRFQVPVVEIPCEFDSHLPHQSKLSLHHYPIRKL